MGAKPVLGSVVWTHTIFRFFPNAYRNKLCVSANFMILGATDQKLWKFEVLRRSLGKAGMCMRKSWPKVPRGGGGDGVWKKGHSVQIGGLSHGRSVVPNSLRYSHFLHLKKNKIDFFFGKCKEWAMAFGRMGVQHPHFLKLAPILGSVKCSIFHGDWRFYFFSNFIFPKFRVHLDLHIYRWDFCFMKN
jgi:hypothetical protein